MSTGWNDDDLLFQDLTAAVAEASAVPPEVRRTGRGLFVWRTVDAELAELVQDSSRAEADPVLVRADTSSRRSLSFSGGGLTIEADVDPDPPALRGQVLLDERDAEAPREVTVELVDADPVVVPADAVGYFEVVPFPLGVPFRLRCGRVVTPWVT